MPPRILFLTLLNDVASDRIVAALGGLGCECAVLGSPKAFAARSRFAGAVFPLPQRGGPWLRSLFLGTRLARIVRRWRPDVIVPLDDFSARTLRSTQLRRGRPEIQALIERSLGAPAFYPTLCSREKIVAMAAELGLQTPPQVAVASLQEAKEAAAAFGYPVVLKREQTCGGFGVAVLGDEAALIEAFRKAQRKAAAKRIVQSLFGLDAADQNTLVLQKFVSGPMAFRVVACAEGRVLDGVSFAAEYIHPPVTGASTVLRPLDRPDMEQATAALVAATECSGYVSLDFILSDEGACLIELNPRPVTSGHLGRLYGHDIHAAFAAHLRGVAAEATSPLKAGPASVALFPRELDRDPEGRLVATSPDIFHDVPWDDADAVGIYADWLEARHPAHAAGLRRKLRPKPVATLRERGDVSVWRGEERRAVAR